MGDENLPNLIDDQIVSSFVDSDAAPPRVCGPGGQLLQDDDDFLYCENQDAFQDQDSAVAEDRGAGSATDCVGANPVSSSVPKTRDVRIIEFINKMFHNPILCHLLIFHKYMKR